MLPCSIIDSSNPPVKQNNIIRHLFLCQADTCRACFNGQSNYTLLKYPAVISGNKNALRDSCKYTFIQRSERNSILLDFIIFWKSINKQLSWAVHERNAILCLFKNGILCQAWKSRETAQIKWTNLLFS